MAKGIIKGTGSGGGSAQATAQLEAVESRMASRAAAYASANPAAAQKVYQSTKERFAKTGPAAIAEISSAGIAALASARAADSARSQTSSPGHKTVTELRTAPGRELAAIAHEAAHVIQQSVRQAVGDLDGDGRPDIAAIGQTFASITNTQKSKHDAVMAAIQNTR